MAITNRNNLEKNLKAFYEALPKLLEENAGRFAVGNAGEGFTCWDTQKDATQYGNIKYRNDFLVKRIEDYEPSIIITRVLTDEVKPF